MSTGISSKEGPCLPVKLDVMAFCSILSNNSALVTLLEYLVKCLKASATGVS